MVFSSVTASIVFGFIRQTKIAFRSIEAITASHEEAGSRYLPWKNIVASIVPELAYVSDHPEKAVERFYDFQYTMAPYPVSNSNIDTRYIFLDFSSSQAVESYCQAKSLKILLQENGMALVQTH